MLSQLDWYDVAIKVIATLIGAAILGCFRSQKFRDVFKRLLRKLISAIRWLAKQWQLIFGLVLLFGVAYGIIALTPTLWAIVLICCLILATVLLIRYSLKSYNDKYDPVTRNVALATLGNFEYDFSNLNAWKSSGWNPEYGKQGLKLVDHAGLKKVLLNDELPEFVNGEIECEVNLEKGALFNVMLGDISNDFYMARFDTRPAYWDCFLIRPKGERWRVCNARSTLKHHSPAKQWLKMRVVVDGKRLFLYRDDMLVDEIDNAEIIGGRIGLFAELSNVRVRKVRILLGATKY